MFNSYDKFTENFKKVIQRGAWLCLNEFKRVITSPHLFLGIICVPESLAYEILRNTGVFSNANKSIFDTMRELMRVKPNVDYNQVFGLSIDKETIKIMEHAADIAISYNHTRIGTEHLLAAMVDMKIAPLIEELNKAKITLAELQKNIHEILRSRKGKQNITHSTTQYPITAVKKQGKNTASFKKEAIRPTPALDYFTIDLTNKEKQKNLYPLIGRTKEMARLINILSRKHKNNPLLLGEPGVGKTAIVEGFAAKIINGDVPDILASKRVLTLDLNALVAGTIYRGEFESRLKQIIEEVKTQEDVILFIDEIHNLVGAGSASGSLDAANILKPYLARGEITCIGATTFAEFKSHFERDATLERRFQPIIIEEPVIEETLQIIKGIKTKLEEYHRVTITDEALEEAVNLSVRFLPHKYLPDKAIDILDEASSRFKVEKNNDTFGKKIRKIKEKLKNLITEKETAVSQEEFSTAIVYKKKEESLLQKLYNLKQRQKKNKAVKIGTIDKVSVVQVVADMVKIPFLEMANIDPNKLLHLEDILGKRVLGQKKVLQDIARTLRRAHVGLADPKRPLASFIFLGPSGVGKTETARAIAEEIFGDKNTLIRINMSEFQESFNISKLIGAPAGYVGYKDGNQLADKVRSKPYAVVLFDEMEKAHPDVFNLLLQVLEDGYLIDATGKYINFKNTVIVFTSNIGLERFNRTQQLGFNIQKNHQKERIQEQFEELKSNILKELQETYKVEFLNRIDKILFFEPLNHGVVSQIVELNIQELNNKLIDKAIQIELLPDAKKVLAKLSFSPDDGARSVRRIVQEYIEERLVEKLLTGVVKQGDKVKVEARGERVLLRK